VTLILHGRRGEICASGAVACSLMRTGRSSSMSERRWSIISGSAYEHKIIMLTLEGGERGERTPPDPDPPPSSLSNISLNIRISYPSFLARLVSRSCSLRNLSSSSCRACVVVLCASARCTRESKVSSIESKGDQMEKKE
jgi:hypothetical protein